MLRFKKKKTQTFIGSKLPLQQKYSRFQIGFFFNPTDFQTIFTLIKCLRNRRFLSFSSAMKINDIMLLCLRADVIGKEMSQEEKIQLKDKNCKEKKKGKHL